MSYVYLIYDAYIIYILYIYTLRLPSETSSSLSSKEMGMCATLLRVIEVSNCAAMRWTSTIADITGGITAVDRCSSCA